MCKIVKIQIIVLAPVKSTNIINDGYRVNLNFDFCKIIAVYRQFADWMGAELKKAKLCCSGIIESE